MPILALLSRRMLACPGRRAQAEALPADFAIVRENADRAGAFAALGTSTLVVDGSVSRPYLRKSVAALAAVIPDAKRVTFPDQKHAATQNRDESGHPDVIGPVLIDFFRC